MSSPTAARVAYGPSVVDDEFLTAGRKAGSGLSGDVATAVEELLAAHLRNDSAAVLRQEQILQLERRRGFCGLDQRTISSWISSLVRALALPVATARRAAPGSPGDVEAILRDGTSRWLEVKAQTKKADFRDLTQADWVRDGTDALAWLAHQDTSFQKAVGPIVARLLRDRVPRGDFRDWTFADLWLADVALVTSEADRVAVGIRTPTDLRRFLNEKYLLHITQAGGRLVPLGGLLPVKRMVEGTPLKYELKKNRVSLISVPLSVAASGAAFTYHVYQPDVPGQLKGRHKLHAGAVVGADRMLQVP